MARSNNTMPGRLFKRGRVFWLDYTPRGKHRIRESCRTRDETEAWARMANRILEVERGAKKLTLPQMALIKAIIGDLDNAHIAVIGEIIRRINPDAIYDEDESKLNHLIEILDEYLPGDGTAQSKNNSTHQTLESLMATLTGQGKPKTITLKELRDEWKEAKLEKKSIADDEQRFRLILKHFGEDRDISSITPRDIEAWKKKLKTTKTARGNLYAKATIKQYFVLLRSAFNFAARRKYYHQDPFSSVDTPKPGNARERIATKEEYEKILKHASGSLRTAIILGYETGMRRAEISGGSTWDRVHYNNEQPHILIPGDETKNDENAYIVLTDEAVAELKYAKEEKRTKPVELTADAITKQFRKLTQELEIEDLKFHDLRATFTSAMILEQGMDIAKAGLFTRHKSLETLRKHYLVAQRKNLHDIRRGKEK